jgi:hypothetical protein
LIVGGVVAGVALLIGLNMRALRTRLTPGEKAILGNARQLAASADQYFLESGFTTVAYSELVGPTKYMKAVNVVVGESYPMYFTLGTTITVTGPAGMRTITYSP